MSSRPLLDLPRLVMRRAVLVGLLTILVAVVVGLYRAREAIDDEVDAAMTLGTIVSRLGTLGDLDDAQAIESLRALQSDGQLRHLVLTLHDADGRLLLSPPPNPAPVAWLDALALVHRWLLPAPDSRSVSWGIARPVGAAWTATLHAASEGERREALADLAGILVVLLLGLTGLLLVMRWNMRRAFAPLADLLNAISGIEDHRLEPTWRLPPMPIRELESIANALRHLASALVQAQSRRRLLSQKVLTLQEDERNHLARELHDEFGQRLSALRVDAAWLARQLSDQPALLEVVHGMSARCAEVQHDIRAMLVQLRPLGFAGEAGGADALSLDRLTVMLEALVQSWRDTRAETTFTLDTEPDAPASPANAQARELPLDLALTVYRISQEALTNAARHAQARHITLRLRRAMLPGEPAAEGLHWSVCDDGVGLSHPSAAMQRGNGLAGMQERVWAQGGQWQMVPTAGGGDRPGLTLSAHLPLCKPAEGMTPP